MSRPENCLYHSPVTMSARKSSGRRPARACPVCLPGTMKSIPWRRYRRQGRALRFGRFQDAFEVRTTAKVRETRAGDVLIRREGNAAVLGRREKKTRPSPETPGRPSAARFKQGNAPRRKSCGRKCRRGAIKRKTDIFTGELTALKRTFSQAVGSQYHTRVICKNMLRSYADMRGAILWLNEKRARFVSITN